MQKNLPKTSIFLQTQASKFACKAVSISSATCFGPWERRQGYTCATCTGTELLAPINVRWNVVTYNIVS